MRAPHMTPRRVRQAAAAAVAFLAGGAAITGAVLVMLARLREPAPAPEAIAMLPSVHMLAVATPYAGRFEKYGGSWYAHELTLQDGRTVRYTTGKVLSATQCLDVDVREYRGRPIVVSVVELPRSCRDGLGTARFR